MGRKKKGWLILFILLVVIVIILILNRDKPEEPTIKLYLNEENRVIELKIEQYLCGVVAAEMPASFALEALKAQAVCARTYALKRLIKGHKYSMKADLSDDIKECQAYISKKEFASRHPYNHKKLYQKIEQAVQETRGEIMLYKGKPLDALYHSTCGGRTANAGEIWNTNIPYLQSVECNYCQESPHYTSTQVFSMQSLYSNLNVNEKVKHINITEKTASGRARKVKINDSIMSADTFRQSLDLPSTWWRIKLKNNKLVIYSRGYGHGAGMCQYGANGMALQGNNYKDILKYYYQDFKFYKMTY